MFRQLTLSQPDLVMVYSISVKEIVRNSSESFGFDTHQLIHENQVEQNSVKTDEIHESHREVAFVLVEELERMKEDQCKLSHLENRQERFPPSKVRLDLWKACDENEITVDHNVDECVEEPEEGRMTAGKEFDSPPNRSRHDTVMCHVISVDEIKAFAENEDECFEEVGELAEEVNVAASGHLKESSSLVQSTEVSSVSCSHSISRR
jgi:hypothetical protein